MRLMSEHRAGKYEKHSYANHTEKADTCAALMAGTGVVL